MEAKDATEEACGQRIAESMREVNSLPKDPATECCCTTKEARNEPGVDKEHSVKLDTVQEAVKEDPESVHRVFVQGYKEALEDGDKIWVEDYDTGYSDGYDDGLSADEDLNEAYNEGYDEGYDEGYEDGRIAGDTEGYEAGYKAGLDSNGFNAGYDEGYKDGTAIPTTSSDVLKNAYDVGYAKGLNEGQGSIFSVQERAEKIGKTKGFVNGYLVGACLVTLIFVLLSIIFG